MSNLPEFSNLESQDTKAVRRQLVDKMVPILREYHMENTRGHNPKWTSRFREAGISDDDGKTAIACARRLGMEIS
ncbi:MAG: hypothetical protein QW177_06950 [Candidatus Nitrosotenuis sp.]